MEEKRCTNCGKFPFCEIEPGECDKNQNWIKREVKK